MNSVSLPSHAPNVALEATGHSAGFFLGSWVGGVWPAPQLGRSAYPKDGRGGKNEDFGRKFRALPCRLSIVNDTRQGRHYDSTTLQLHIPTRLMTVWGVPFRDLRCLAGVLTA